MYQLMIDQSSVIALCLLDKYVFVYMIAGFQRSILPRFQDARGLLSA